MSRRIRDGATRSAEVTAALLDRIDRLDGRLHSTTAVLADSAMGQAGRADAEIAAGRWRGPLHGVPVGVKDLLWTRGVPTTAGMDLLRDFRPDEDATVITRLKDAGAVIIAKHTMSEAGALHHHPAFARPVNPWSADHWTGISSSGSAVATAAGLCFAAIGSDTGGSIRMPCSATNITGIKPTWGRVSRSGAIDSSASFDHLGPMARSAADAAAVLSAIAGFDARDPTSLRDPVPDYLACATDGVDGLTLGIDWGFAATGMPEEIVAALEDTRVVLERLGMRVREVAFPWGAEEAESARVTVRAGFALSQAESFRRHSDRYSATVHHMMEDAARITAIDVARGHLVRERYRGRLRTLFADVDLVLVPGLGRRLPTWDAMDAVGPGRDPVDPDLVRYMMPFNFAGNPVISLPAGFGPTGLPVGIQLAGSWLAEPVLIRAGVAFQARTDHHRHVPDV